MCGQEARDVETAYPAEAHKGLHSTLTQCFKVFAEAHTSRSTRGIAITATVTQHFPDNKQFLLLAERKKEKGWFTTKGRFIFEARAGSGRFTPFGSRLMIKND